MTIRIYITILFYFISVYLGGFTFALPTIPPFDNEANETVESLRTYCQSCHGLGKFRFIYSDDNKIVWEDIFVRQPPFKKETWRNAIIRVLDWPNDKIPAFGTWLDKDNKKDYMPKGFNRIKLHQSFSQEGESLRKFILRTLTLRAASQPCYAAILGKQDSKHACVSDEDTP